MCVNKLIVISLDKSLTNISKWAFDLRSQRQICGVHTYLYVIGSTRCMVEWTPIKGACVKLVSSCLSDPFTPPTDTTTLLVAGYLLIKTWLLGNCLQTNTHTHTHTHAQGTTCISWACIRALLPTFLSRQVCSHTLKSQVSVDQSCKDTHL